MTLKRCDLSAIWLAALLSVLLVGCPEGDDDDSGPAGGNGSICRAGAGGGGSYNVGGNQSNSAGARSGDGQVVISWYGRRPRTFVRAIAKSVPSDLRSL